MKHKIVFLLISVLLFSVCKAQNSRVEKWEEDLSFYHKTLEEKHIDLYHTISKEDFKLELQTIKKNISKLTDFELIIELMKLTQRIGAGKGDGHTSVPLWGMGLEKFPIKLFDFGKELRVIEAPIKYSKLLGSKLIKIDNTPIEDIYKKVASLTPFTENIQSLKQRVCQYMVISEILHALHLTKEKDKAVFTYIDDEGKEENITVNTYTNEEIEKFEYRKISISHPSIIQPENTKNPGLWFTSLNNNKTVYIKFHRYPSEEEMNGFAENVYNFINNQKSNDLIIDLRDNYGGDFFKGLILSGWLNACDSINWKSNVYVLVDRVTFSAAMVNAVQYKQILNAKVIGEPTGANPNGYQDMDTFNLPHSNLLISHSKRLFRFQDNNTMGLIPDVTILPKWDNYKKGVDEILNWVLEDISKN